MNKLLVITAYYLFYVALSWLITWLIGADIGYMIALLALYKAIEIQVDRDHFS